MLLLDILVSSLEENKSNLPPDIKKLKEALKPAQEYMNTMPDQSDKEMHDGLVKLADALVHFDKLVFQRNGVCRG